MMAFSNVGREGHLSSERLTITTRISKGGGDGADHYHWEAAFVEQPAVLGGTEKSSRGGAVTK